MPGNRNTTPQHMAERQAIAMDTELRDAFTTGTNHRWDLARDAVDESPPRNDRYTLAVRDTGNYRLNIIAIIERALEEVSPPEQARILNYVLSGIPGVMTDVDS